jgi:hypothetical protein
VEERPLDEFLDATLAGDPNVSIQGLLKAIERRYGIVADDELRATVKQAWERARVAQAKRRTRLTALVVIPLSAILCVGATTVIIAEVTAQDRVHLALVAAAVGGLVGVGLGLRMLVTGR